MLLKYKVANYRSIDAMQEFSMFAGASRRSLNRDHVVSMFNNNILKGATIYGANAAGKTNFIDSLFFSRWRIVTNAMPNMRYQNCYCRFSPKNKDRETYFEFMFSNKGRIFYYGFEILLSSNKIVGEWLLEYFPLENKETVIFERTGNKCNFSDQFSETEKSRLQYYIDDMSNKDASLFLSEMGKKSFKSDSKLYSFNIVFDWFDKKLFVGITKTPTKDDYVGAAKWLKSFGTGVSDFVFKEIDSNVELPLGSVMKQKAEDYFITNSDKKDVIIFMNYCYTKNGTNDFNVTEICTKHDSTSIPFHIYEESSGVTELMNYLSILGKNDDCTYVLDEFGKLMHPSMAYNFIEKYYELGKKSSDQLIVATHHISLMTLNLYRRDEIWFVNKDEMKSGTELYSLEEFQERFDKKIDKAYLEGRYGALPVFDDIISD